MEKLLPGMRAEVSGQYGLVHPKRGRTGHEVTVVQGEPFPPTPEAGMWYVLVDRTRHTARVSQQKSGR